MNLFRKEMRNRIGIGIVPLSRGIQASPRFLHSKGHIFTKQESRNPCSSRSALCNIVDRHRQNMEVSNNVGVPFEPSRFARARQCDNAMKTLLICHLYAESVGSVSVDKKVSAS